MDYTDSCLHCGLNWDDSPGSRIWNRRVSIFIFLITCACYPFYIQETWLHVLTLWQNMGKCLTSSSYQQQVENPCSLYSFRPMSKSSKYFCSSDYNCRQVSNRNWNGLGSWDQREEKVSIDKQREIVTQLHLRFYQQ